MIQKFRKLSLESQLFLSFMAVCICLLLLSLSITLFSTITRQRQEIDKNISALASYIASMDNVISMLENGYPDDSAIEELDSLSENFSDLNVIAVYNTNGLRFYHTNRQETGETFVGGEEEAILKGSQPYITTGYGTHGTQRRAFHAVLSKDGHIIGFIMASVFNTYIFEQMQTLFPTYLLAAMVMLVVSVLLSHGLVSLLRDSLMGHHPTELLDLYLRQDVVLNALEEGLIATDSNGVIAYANQAARQLFQLPQPAPATEGCHFKDLFPASQADRVLTSGVPSYHRACTNGNHRLLVSEVPVNSQTGSHAVLTIINDQTDMETVMSSSATSRQVRQRKPSNSSSTATSSPASRSGRQPTASAYQRSAPWSSERRCTPQNSGSCSRYPPTAGVLRKICCCRWKITSRSSETFSKTRLRSFPTGSMRSKRSRLDSTAIRTATSSLVRTPAAGSGRI